MTNGKDLPELRGDVQDAFTASEVLQPALSATRNASHAASERGGAGEEIESGGRNIKQSVGGER